MSSLRIQMGLTNAGLVLLALALASCGKGPQTSRQNGGQGEFTIDVHTVQTQPFVESVFATGTLVANESIVLRAERAGIVREIRFQEGRPIKAGETLLRIDDSELQAQLAGAQARLELAQAVEARDKALFETKMLSAAEYEQSSANLHVVQADLELTKAQIEKTRVVAPFDGIAGLRLVSPGAYLVPGAAIASLNDIAALKLDFTISERYLPMLRIGQQATFRVAGRVETFTATISAIEPAVAIETRSVQLRASVSNQEQKLMPGSFAELRITLDEDPKAILIPAIALVPGLKEQKVFLFQNGTAVEREVQIGLRTADSIQILEGLQPGDQLITSGILQLRNGMRVRSKPSASPTATPRTSSQAEGNGPAGTAPVQPSTTQNPAASGLNPVSTPQDNGDRR
jgi:membrane fusion protein, multidrug efflux system